VRQSNGRLGHCSTSITLAAASSASTVSVCWVGVASMPAPEPKSTDGSCRSLENASGGTVPRVNAILASSSAASL